MNAIGGYFELELRNGEHYHKGAVKLNSARNCFEYILLARKYRKVWMPYYTCDVMFEPLKRLGIDYEYYHINEDLEPEKLPELKEHEAFLYTNYFGLKQNCVTRLSEIYGQKLIVDNAQAFYARPVVGIDTFYSPRKFFGVPDGGYLYTAKQMDFDFPQAVSINRMTHLLKRIEFGAEVGYEDYQSSEQSLCNRPVERMSMLTEALLQSIDYTNTASLRRRNYIELSEHLSEHNLLLIKMEADDVPMVYPLLTNSDDLRDKFIENKIYIAKYWSNMHDGLNSFEKHLVNNLLPLPIDQRYFISNQICVKWKRLLLSGDAEQQ